MLDTKQHHLPHIHVEYAESEAIFQIPDGDLLEGELPSKQYKLVQAWIALHSDELMADWKLAASGVTPYKIEPLREALQNHPSSMVGVSPACHTSTS